MTKATWTLVALLAMTYTAMSNSRGQNRASTTATKATAYDDRLFRGFWERDKVHDPLSYKGHVRGGFRMCYIDPRHNCYEDYTNNDFTNWRWRRWSPDMHTVIAFALLSNVIKVCLSFPPSILSLAHTQAATRTSKNSTPKR